MQYIKFCVLICLQMLVSKAFSQIQNQNALAKAFSEGNYQIYKVENNDFVASPKTWPFKVFFSSSQDGQGNTMVEKVEINRANVILEVFKPDIAAFPAYFGLVDSRITFLKEYVLYYTYSQEHATIKYILCKNCPKPDYKKISLELDEYILNVFNNQKDARQQIVADKERQSETDKIKFSLKDKSVKAIKIVINDLPNELGHYSQVPYGIEATLANGEVFKTPNIGGKTDWENFKIEVQGAVFAEEKLEISGECTNIPNDQLKIKAFSKFQPQVADTKIIDLNYNTSVSINYSGGSGGKSGIYVSKGMRGYDGASLNLYAKTTKHKVTGESLTQVEVRDATGKAIHRIKLASSATLNINVSGGNGSYGDASKAAGNGGNGGNVTLYKDPNCPNPNINVSNVGGNGGKNDKTKISGAGGSNGRFQTLTQSVNLTW